MFITAQILIYICKLGHIESLLIT